MALILDIEANSLVNPSKIWVVVCKDTDTGEYYIFREVTDNAEELQALKSLLQNYETVVGHNFLGYDAPHLDRLCGIRWDNKVIIDTLVISKLIDYSRPNGHSLDTYGEELNIPKDTYSNFSKYTIELENRCITDVNINEKVYLKYLKYINSTEWYNSINLEHKFQSIVNILNTNGFSFNITKANKLLEKVTLELSILDKDILEYFTPKSKLIRIVVPRKTKHGTISRVSIPRSLGNDLSVFEEGAPFSLITFEAFNPSSHKQIVDVLSSAGWSPTDKTKTHLEVERRINRLKYQRSRTPALDAELSKLYDDLYKLKKYGWKINETNLSSLPSTAPSPARTLAKRILLEARRRTLTEWLGLVAEDGRIHGKFYGIGAWTHRMAHQQPNTANIPNEFDTFGKKKLLGKEMRSLWQAPKGRLLVGVDAEGIQLRIFAHYIDDPEFTRALVEGKKDDKTDPHSLNQRVLGSVCKSRAAAKRFIYALLLGAGTGKLAEILGCSVQETEHALDRLMSRYQGWALLKEEEIPRDAKRGYFVGLDGRKVLIPGETMGQRKHLCMSGYLQNGEAVCMKLATLLWYNQLEDINGTLGTNSGRPSELSVLRADDDLVDTSRPWKIVNFVHDEWQTECTNNVDIALKIAKIQSDSLQTVGTQLGLKCPLAGSYYNEDLKDYTIGTNWSVTH